jgi:AMP phosphorylase
MQLKVRIFKLLAGRPIAILNSYCATKMNIHVSERVSISKDGKKIISIIDTTNSLLKQDEIALSNEIIEELSLNEGDNVEVNLVEKPESNLYIKKKIDGFELDENEINTIIKDIVDNALTEVEISYFVSAVYKNGMTDKETEFLIKSMVATGRKLSFPGKVVDKHSIGGIAANRTTPIVVSLCASAGLVMPKTSSRAITSAAGTADTIESIAKVEFSVEEMKNIVRRTKACMLWNGILGLSPADDKLIQIEKIINIDPEAQLLASVLSKKIAAGSKYVIIDIPYGGSAKVDKKGAWNLKKKFEHFGKKFGLIIKCVLTKGEEPIGNGIGPFLEIRDIIKVLKREDSPKDLEDKSVYIAGEIFELCGVVKKGKGEYLARDILNSGKAFEKFKEIIEAQQGHVPEIREIEKELGKFRKDFFAEKEGKVTEIDNKKINLSARLAGSPIDKGSGIYLNKHVGDKVSRGDLLFTIYSESEVRLKSATDVCHKLKPIRIS